MAEFVANKPVETKVPKVLVDAGLKPGRYRFQLVVVDDQGNSSKPSSIIVDIVERRRIG